MCRIFTEKKQRPLWSRRGWRVYNAGRFCVPQKVSDTGRPGVSSLSPPTGLIQFLLCSSSFFRSTVLQQQFNRVGKVETGSVALPAIMRSGAGGPESFQMGSMPQARQHITSGQMHRGHMPPLVKKNKNRPCQIIGRYFWNIAGFILALQTQETWFYISINAR